MSIATAITAAQGKVSNAYTAVSNKGGTLPATQNLSNLPTAINSIPSGGSAPVITSLSVTPTTSAQTITAPSGTDGYSPVTVSAVTSSIDANITAGNIKKDVQILGVTGTYEGSGGGGGTQEKTFGNYYIMEDDSIMPVYFDKIEVSGNNQSNVILSDAVTDMDGTQRTCSIYLLSYSNSIIYASALQLTNIQNVSLSTTGLRSLGIKKIVYKSVTGQFYALNGGVLNVVGTSASTLTTIDLSNATSIYMRGACIGLTTLEDVKMDKAENVTITRASAVISGTFKNTSVTELRFPALKTTSTIEIQYMLSNLDGCTVHFPSNLVSTIQGLTGYPNFGGTNTVLAFDLPATS